MKKGRNYRTASYKISNFILDRWSPRSMSGHTISKKELFSLFEAARWAPSSSNIQPWRFIYVKRNTKNWYKIFDTLLDFNKIWNKNASHLVCIVSKKTNSKGKLNYHHMSDTGAAWQNIALQGFNSNLVIHGMAGFDQNKIRKNLKVPKEYDIVHIFAIGKPGKITDLNERMRKSEFPSQRNPVSNFVSEGNFKSTIR